MIVVDLVTFLAAGVKVVDERLMRMTQDESSRLERRRVMAALGRRNAVAVASEHHFRQLLHGIVRDREAAIGGELLDGRVGQVTLHHGPQLIELGAACLVPVQAS